jgi:S-(hydroxymethyl)glutathione dehydrogenase/alcohol dehydrogenase
MTHFVNPKEVDGDIVVAPGRADRRRRRLHLRLHGNTDVMRRRSNAAHRGWGESIIIGVAGAGRKSPPARSSWSPAGPGKAPPSAARGPHRRAEDRRLVHVDGKIEIDPMITHKLCARRDQQGLRPDARGQIDPRRRGLLMPVCGSSR